MPQQGWGATLYTDTFTGNGALYVVVTKRDHPPDERSYTHNVFCWCREKDGDRTLSLQEQLEGVRAAVYRIPATISNYYAAYVSLGQSAKLISADLQRFLTSDSTELPQSLRQCGQLIEAGVSPLPNHFPAGLLP